MTTFKATVETHGTARVETGIVTHEGRDYAALGSVVDPDHGIICGYVNAAETEIQTWTGEAIGTLRRVGTARGFHGSRIACYSATVQGKRYHGRGPGPCMFLRLRASK